MRMLIGGFGLLIIPITAQAYFDPGTGSLIIQALIGAMAAVTVFWGRIKYYIQSLLPGSANKKVDVPPGTDDTSDETNDSGGKSIGG